MNNLIVGKSMNKAEFSKKYREIVNENKIPILVTNDESYFISPEAVNHLAVSETGISFSATFNRGLPITLAFLWHDVVALIEE